MALDDSLLNTMDREKLEQARIRNLMKEIFAEQDHSGGGGGSGLEPRVNRLEERVDKIGDDLGTVKTDIATIKENIRHLPEKGFIVTAVVTTIALLTAIIVFADKIKTVFGLTG